LEVHDLLAGIAVLVGLFGIVVVVLPGLALQLAAVTLWAFEEGSPGGWAVFGLTLAIAIAAWTFKYVFPGKQLRQHGIPGWVLVAAVGAAIAGFFMIPVVGAPIGFVLAVYVFERARRGRAEAWPSTKVALKAVLTSIGIELTGGFLILLVFVVGTIAT
jgi:hypothetical protein